MLRIYDKYNPNANPANTDYPNGSGRDETISGANDGTPLDMNWYNDMLGYSEALLLEGQLEPSGNPDTALVSDRLAGLRLSTIKTYVASNYTGGDLSAVSVIYVGLDLSTVDYVIDRNSLTVWSVGSVTGTITADDLNTSTGAVSGASSVLTNINSLSDLSGKRVTHNFASDANYTLTALQNAYGTIVLTDTGALLTTTRTVTVSSTERGLTIYNNTAQSLTIKTASGVGVTITAGNYFNVYVDGTNVVKGENPPGINQSIQEAELTDTGALFLDGTPSYRSTGVTYTNNTGKAMFVSIIASIENNTSSSVVSVSVDGETVSTIGLNSQGSIIVMSATAVIPNGATYSYEKEATAALDRITETRDNT